MSFETVPENSVGAEATSVPEAASSHRKRTIANSGQPCSSDHQLWGWRRLEMAAVGSATRWMWSERYRDARPRRHR